MKSFLVLCMAMMVLFSSCLSASATSASMPSKLPSSSGLAVQSEIPSDGNTDPTPITSTEPIEVTALPEYIPLEKLPEKYTTEDALADGVIVLIHSKYEGGNQYLIPVFLQQVIEGKTAKLRMKEYTIEGDPIYKDLEYLPEEHCYRITFDSTRDEFSATKEIYSRKYAWLWLQPPRTEEPEHYNPNTYLALSCWKTISAVPEGQYPFTLLPIPENIMEETIALIEQLRCDCADIQRIFDPSGEMEAKLFSDGNVSIINNDEEWIVEKLEFPFDHLEWSNDSCLKFMNGESMVRLYSPAQKAFLCTGVPPAINQ